jgi:hypothetical protein
MSRITTLSGIIKENPTCCCSAGSLKRVVRSLCNIARGWVGSYVITIKKLRELAGKSRPMAVRLRPGRAYAKADALLMTMTVGELTSW